MNIRQIFVGVALSVASMVGGCTTETHLNTHVARIPLEPVRYAAFVSSLDAEMAKLGLTRYGAAPGLNEAKGRSVLFADYRFHLSDNWGFLTAHDIVKTGVIEVRVYPTVLKDERIRSEAMLRLNLFLETFGAHLIANPEAVKR
jgi:hypothetical protein